MITNKKGLSGIVTTLIIILLVLVSVGVIWGVVGNLLTKGTGSIGQTQKCLDVDLRATKVNSTGVSGEFNVTLERKPTGEGEVGAKLIFFSEDGTASATITVEPRFEPLTIATQTIVTEMTNPVKVRVTPYFRDDSGKDVLCSSYTEFEFELA